MSFREKKNIYPNINDVEPDKNRSTQIDVENQDIAVQTADNIPILPNNQSSRYNGLKRTGLIMSTIMNILFILAGIVTLIIDRESHSENEKFYYLVLAITIVSSLMSYVTYIRCKKNFKGKSYSYMMLETFIYILLLIESMVTVGVVYKYLLSKDIKDNWKENYPTTFWYLLLRSAIDIIHLVIFGFGYIYMFHYFIKSC